MEVAPVAGAHSRSSQSLQISFSSPIHFSYLCCFSSSGGIWLSLMLNKLFPSFLQISHRAFEYWVKLTCVLLEFLVLKLLSNFSTQFFVLFLFTVLIQVLIFDFSLQLLFFFCADWKIFWRDWSKFDETSG